MGGENKNVKFSCISFAKLNHFLERRTEYIIEIKNLTFAAPNFNVQQFLISQGIIERENIYRLFL